MYSSGDILCMIMCVSNMMKPQNKTAPPIETTNSSVSLQKNACRERNDTNYGGSTSTN